MVEFLNCCYCFIKQGVTTAAAITIDWQAIKFYCYFYSHSVFSMLYNSRAARFARDRVLSPTAQSYSSVYAYLLLMLQRRRGAPDSAHSAATITTSSSSTTTTTELDEHISISQISVGRDPGNVSIGIGVEQPQSVELNPNDNMRSNHDGGDNVLTTSNIVNNRNVFNESCAACKAQRAEVTSWIRCYACL